MTHLKAAHCWLLASSTMCLTATASSEPAELRPPTVECLLVVAGKDGDLMPGRNGDRFGHIVNPGLEIVHNGRGVITAVVEPHMARRGPMCREIWQFADGQMTLLNVDRAVLPGGDGAMATMSKVSIARTQSTFTNPLGAGGGETYFDMFEPGVGRGIMVRRLLQGENNMNRNTREGLWYCENGESSLVARTGQQCPDSPAGHQFLELRVSQPPVTDGQGLVAFAATVAVNGDDRDRRTGIWMGPKDKLARVAYFGEPARLGGNVFWDMSDLTIDRKGRLHFLDQTPHHTGRQNEGISGQWMFDGTGFTKRIAPGMKTKEGHVIRTIVCATYPCANEEGTALFAGEIVAEGPFPMAIFMVNDDGVHTLLVNGQAATGMQPASIVDLNGRRMFALSQTGDWAAVLVKTDQPADPRANERMCLWRLRPGKAEVVAYEDGPLGDLAAYRIRGLSPALGVSIQGEVLFSAELQATDLGAKEPKISGVWTGTPAAKRLVTRFPMPVTMGTRGSKTIQNFVPIRGSMFDTDGAVHSVVRFSDRSGAIVRFVPQK
ncbi:MAG: hypothetical protein K1X67_09410 [Fimbriimonadaceae bacterium]|nr:hypothetical protein [Fimbriimonadaceae bacterium]